MKTHRHYWNVIHSVWEGRKKGENAVVRYCICGKRQMGFVAKWGKIPKSYEISESEANSFGGALSVWWQCKPNRSKSDTSCQVRTRSIPMGAAI